MRDRPVLTIDFQEGSRAILEQRIQAVNDHLPRDAATLTISSLTRSLIGSWLNGRLATPQPTVRVTVRLSLGSYRKFTEKISRQNALLPPNANRLTEQRLVRSLVGSWCSGAKTMGWVT